MSKSRPKKVYQATSGTEKVIVLARHVRGARTVAAEYLGTLPRKEDVIELPGVMGDKARNRKEQSHG